MIIPKVSQLSFFKCLDQIKVETSETIYIKRENAILFYLCDVFHHNIFVIFFITIFWFSWLNINYFTEIK